MLIFPAIDILDGKVVRLTQGDYEKKQIYSDTPVKTALAFQSAGAKYLHLVDLDGAKYGSPKNRSNISEIAATTSFFIECGGGIRNEADIEWYLNAGISRVILGTAALKDKQFTKRMLQLYGSRIAIGVDARDSKIAVEGWLLTSEVDSIAFCKEMKEIGAEYIIYTDISKDGAGKGTNLSVYQKLAEIEGLNVTASGGVSSMEEIEQLDKMGIYAVILGKAIYTGLINLEKAIKITEK